MILFMQDSRPVVMQTGRPMGLQEMLAALLTDDDETRFGVVSVDCFLLCKEGLRNVLMAYMHEGCCEWQLLGRNQESNQL